MSVWDFEDPIVSDPPADIVYTRVDRSLRYLGTDKRMHRLTVRDTLTVDDVVVNQGKAFLYSLLTGEGYKRPETPAVVRDTLTRTGLVF